MEEFSGIRIGIFGASRGAAFAANAAGLGAKVVAVCDKWREKAENLARQFDAAVYEDFDALLEHDLDAIVTANFFHQHAPYAIRALEAGKHVISECLACKTPAEGVALARAVEKSGKVYFFAENYAYILYVQEMRRLYQAGEIGKLLYAEGEYNHPMDADGFNRLSPGVNHWRNNIAPTYYCTHALSPLLYVSDTRPVSVNAQAIYDEESFRYKRTARRGDLGFVMILRLDNGGVARLFGLGLAGHSIWYRMHGQKGLMENLRTGNQGMLRVLHEPWDIPPDEPIERIYTPRPPLSDLAAATGHGGGDFYTMYYFLKSIATGEAPWMNVYRGLDMSLAGIQAWRSCLNNGQNYEVPDFRKEEVRKRYENDHWSPFPEDAGPGQPYPSVLGDIKPSPEALEHARKIWREMGYEGE